MSIDYTKMRTTVRDPNAKDRVKLRTKPRVYDERARWWDGAPDKCQDGISATLDVLTRYQKTRMTQALACARLYGNLPLPGAYGVGMAQLPAAHPLMKAAPITYNMIQIAVDTATAQIAKNRPKPYFLTSGADYHTMRKAKKLNKLIDGTFYAAKMNATGPLVFRDGAVFGTGVAHVYPDMRSGKVEIEKIDPGALWVDELEARDGNPRQMHYLKLVDKDVLADAFPDFRDQINEAAALYVDGKRQTQTVSNLVTLRESWHLPSGYDEKGNATDDGRHVLSVSNAVLNPEPEEQRYERDHFPFAFFRWNARLPSGFWGQGGAEQSQAPQLELNQFMWVAQRSFKLAGTFKVFIDRGSTIDEEHITNDIGGIVYYTGTPPNYVVPQVLPAEHWVTADRLARQILEIFGVSQTAARSTKPAGLNSGAALREFKDEANERMTTIGQAYEQFHVDTASLVLEAIQDIRKERGNYKVKVPGNKFLSTVDWKSINLEEEKYTLQCYPISSLPNDPAGRLQTVQEYIQAGFLTPRQGKRLLDYPDLEKVESLHNAAEDYVEMRLDGIVDDGTPWVPDPDDDMALITEMAREYLQQGKMFELEPERLELLRRVVLKIEDYKAQAAEAAQAAQAAQQMAGGLPGAGGPGPGMGAPQAPPVAPAPSPLVPAAPTA